MSSLRIEKISSGESPRVPLDFAGGRDNDDCRDVFSSDSLDTPKHPLFGPPTPPAVHLRHPSPLGNTAHAPAPMAPMDRHEPVDRLDLGNHIHEMLDKEGPTLTSAALQGVRGASHFVLNLESLFPEDKCRLALETLRELFDKSSGHTWEENYYPRMFEDFDSLVKALTVQIIKQEGKDPEDLFMRSGVFWEDQGSTCALANFFHKDVRYLTFIVTLIGDSTEYCPEAKTLCYAAIINWLCNPLAFCTNANSEMTLFTTPRAHLLVFGGSQREYSMVHRKPCGAPGDRLLLMTEVALQY